MEVFDDPANNFIGKGVRAKDCQEECNDARAVEQECAVGCCTVSAQLNDEILPCRFYVRFGDEHPVEDLYL
jgi:hypothetical protein